MQALSGAQCSRTEQGQLGSQSIAHHRRDAAATSVPLGEIAALVRSRIRV